MKRHAWIWWLIAMTLWAVACEKTDDEADDDQTAADDDASPGDDDDNDDSAPGYVHKFKFDLSFEVDFKAELKLKQDDAGHLEGAFTPQQSFDVVAAGTTLMGEGKLLAFPEAYGRMVTLKLSGPSVPTGPCGDAPISYSLTLTAKENNGYMVGGLVAYCGENTFTGRAARVMRLSGIQELIED
jgi:hypothetical protein